MPCNFAAFRFCCPTGCVYFSDTFDRANNTNLGADWTETSGDWSIDTNRLKIAATDNAKCTCNTTHPTASTKYIVSVSVSLSTDGDVARVFVNNSGQFAEVERITSACGRLRLYDGTTCKGSCNVALGGFTRLVVCVEAAKIHVGTGGSPMLTIPATATSSVVALGTGACTGTVLFEDFSLSKHNSDDATCPACGDEGCTWFAELGCASGSLSAVDWTTAGTWAYRTRYDDNCAFGEESATATIVPTQPFGTLLGRVVVDVLFPLKNATGSPISNKAKVYFDNSDCYVEVEVYQDWNWYGYARIYKSGVQYGPTMLWGWGGSLGINAGCHLVLCWDGSAFSVGCYSGTFGVASPTWLTIPVPHTPDDIAPKMESYSIESLDFDSIGFTATVYKHHNDLASCDSCYSQTCGYCQDGTIPTTISATFANITSHVYGCTCSDTSIMLYPTSTPCRWEGSTTGPCVAVAWTASATITAVTGGYKMTINLATAYGSSAVFEETVLSASPVNCAASFSGYIPLVSSSGSMYCSFESATCLLPTP